MNPLLNPWAMWLPRSSTVGAANAGVDPPPPEKPKQTAGVGSARDIEKVVGRSAPSQPGRRPNDAHRMQVGALTDVTAISPADVERFLAAEDVIRVFVTYAPGFGHQAASVALMKRLCELGFRGRFDVVYDDSTAAKCAVLIPGFRADGADLQEIAALPWQYAPAAMTLRSMSRFRDDPDAPEIALGITGADDGYLNADGHGMGADIHNAAGDYPVVDRVPLRVRHLLKLQPNGWSHNSALLTADGEQPLFDLTKLPVVYPLPEAAELGLEATTDPRADGLRALLANDEAHVVPVYLGGGNKPERLATLVAALDAAGLDRGVVIPCLESIDAEATAAALPHGTRVMNIADPDAVEALASLGAGDVLLLEVGPVHQDLYDAVFARTTLLGLVSGRNSVNLMELLGKPHLAAFAGARVGRPRSESGATYLANSALVDKDGAGGPLFDHLVSFIRDATRDHSEVSRFFRGLSAADQPERDKVFAGLRHVLAALPRRQRKRRRKSVSSSSG